MPLDVEIRDCYLYTGRKVEARPCGSELSPRLPSLLEAPLIGLRISWPAEATFLTVKGQVLTGSENKVSAQFSPGRPGVVATAQQLGIVVQDRPQDENAAVISAAVPRGERLLLTLLVDTENTAFIKAAQNPAFLAVAENPAYHAALEAAERGGRGDDPAALMPVRYDPPTGSLFLTLPVVYFKQARYKPLREPDQIRLTLSNVVIPPPYEGYVAIDLGNTGSSLACIDRASAGRGLAGRGTC